MNALLSTLAVAYRTVLRNPKSRNWVILGSVLYLISPIDLSPDLLPILGQIDDLALVALLFSELSKMAFEGWRDRSPISGDRETEAGNPQRDRDYTQTVDVRATMTDPTDR